MYIMIIYRDSCEGLRNNTCDPTRSLDFLGVFAVLLTF